MIIVKILSILTICIFLLIYLYWKIKKKFNNIENELYNLQKINRNLNNKISRIDNEISYIDEEVTNISLLSKKSAQEQKNLWESFNKSIFDREIPRIIKYYIKKYLKDDTNNDIKPKQLENKITDCKDEKNLILLDKEKMMSVEEAFKIGLENLKEKKKNEYEQLSDKNNNTKNDKAEVDTNKTMMQFFEWYYPNDGSLWVKVKDEAQHLKNIGITALWLPPAYKAHNGINDTGYSTYDLYDLGEFNQKGTVRTKYGTKDEYIEGIKEAHKNGIKIYGDIVFNHKAGADDTELVMARQVDKNNRNVFIGEEREIKAHTLFNFPGRKEKYSAYKWTANDFDGVDYDDITKEDGIFKFKGKEWEQDVDQENGNYDFLMFADLDMDSPYVIEELKRWGKWYMEETKVDGFRLDAIKHIRFDFFKDWLKEMREISDKEIFAVGEYWTWDVNKLKYYLDKCEYSMSLFDAPLHYNFHSASNSSGYFDMRKIKDNSLLQAEPQHTVTFVDNHDTQIGQSLESWVRPWFKPLAYTFILTRNEGYPCVFYGDYYGIPDKGYYGIKEALDIILKARKEYAYGVQHDYFDSNSIIGWTREGDEKHENSGMAALITVALGGVKKMYIGCNHANEIWIDMTGQNTEEVKIDKYGLGEFLVQNGSYSIWIKKG